MKREASRYRGVVFDLDGTLLDSMGFVVAGLTMAVEPYRARPTRAEVMSKLGGPSEVCIQRLLGDGIPIEPALTAYLGYLDSRENEMIPFRGARSLLHALRKAGIPTGIWTGRERESTAARLKELKFDRMFDSIVCGDDLASHKPDPEGLRRIFGSWGLRSSEVLFVGDSDQDLEGGRAARVGVVSILHGRPIAPALLRHAVKVAATPAEAYAWVRAAVLGEKRKQRA